MSINRIKNTMTIIGWKRLAYLVSHKKNVYVWYLSNTRIIYISKLLFKIGDFNTNYDLVEICNVMITGPADHGFHVI